MALVGSSSFTAPGRNAGLDLDLSEVEFIDAGVGAIKPSRQRAQECRRDQPGRARGAKPMGSGTGPGPGL
jgi:hypothetical protein